MKVILRVPIRIKDNDGIRGGQINTQASSTSTDQEDEAVTIGSTETVQGRLGLKERQSMSYLTITHFHSTINTFMNVSLRVQIILNNIQHADHLQGYKAIEGFHT